MKVYIVFSTYDPNNEGGAEPEIMGIFVSRKLAQSNMNYEGYQYPYIEEREVIE